MKKIAQIGIPLSIAIFFIWLTFKDMTQSDFDTIVAAMKSANYFWLVASMLVGALSHWSRAIRWKYTLEVSSLNHNTKVGFFTIMIGYFVNLAIPRLGEVSRVLLFSKYTGNPVDKTMGTVVAERIVDMLILLAVLTGILIFQFEELDRAFQLTEKLQNISPITYVVYALIAGVLLVLFFTLFKKSEHPAITKIKSILSGVWEGLSSVVRMKNKGLFLWHTFLIWVLYIAMFWVAIFCLEATRDLSLGAVIVGFAFGGIAMVVSNGGFGAFPYIISIVLGIYGIDTLSAVAFGWILWAGQTIMLIVFGGLSYFLLRRMAVPQTLKFTNEPQSKDQIT